MKNHYFVITNGWSLRSLHMSFEHFDMGYEWTERLSVKFYKSDHVNERQRKGRQQVIDMPKTITHSF